MGQVYTTFANLSVNITINLEVASLQNNKRSSISIAKDFLNLISSVFSCIGLLERIEFFSL